MEQIIQKNDVELYKEFLHGNEECFNEIMERYRIKLINFIFKYVKNIEVAEDISQDTFVYILLNKKDYDFKYSLKTYIYTIAKSRALNYIKKHKKEIYLDEKYLYELVSDIEIDKSLIREDNKKEITKAISKLNTDYQTIIYLKDFEGFQYKEICTILNKTLPQVKITLYRARKALKRIMNKEGFKC